MFNRAHIIRPMRPRLVDLLVPLLVLALLPAACSSSQPTTFSVSGASVDPTYFCPGGASDARYDVHGTVDVRNGTNGAVTIQSISANMTLVAVQGMWLEKVGDRYDAGDATFTPHSVGAGSTATVAVTITSSCTSDRYESGGSSRGEYAVAMHLVTSAGSFSVTARNHHALVAA
jgi:hypothetical protein